MESKIRKRKFNKSHKEHSSQRGHPLSRYAFQPPAVSNVFKTIFVLCLLTAIVFVTLYASAQDSVNVPFGGNGSFPSEPVLGQHYWSSLLSGHYFGLRSAKPNSPIVSLMWFRNRVLNNGLPIRHWCNRDDNLDKYVWNYNDLEFGDQLIHDGDLQIITSFIKLEKKAIVTRINIADSAKPAGQLSSIILYSATESNEDTIKALNVDSFAENGAFTIKVQSKTSGNFSLAIKLTQGKAVARSYLNANSTLDQLKETVLKNLYIYKDAQSSKSIYMIANSDPEASNYKSNFIAYQIVFQNSIQIEAEMLFDQNEMVDNFDFQRELDSRKATFEQKFEERFPLHKKNISDEKIRFARAILSNTVGGISYFYGTSLVQSENSDVKPYGPIQLLTAVPSRSFFPRGFLWDEGFHQLLISAWDPQLSKTIIKSWFGIMNKNGWIPREIILGDEAKSRVPSEFLVQQSTTANPPTFFLAVESLIDNGHADGEWLREMYPRLERLYHWFNSSQTGKHPGTFRWRGRNATTNLELNPKTFASGLDDFPRATHPTDDEIHLDLRCWMALASRVMAKIGKAIGIEDPSYEQFYRLLQDNSKLERWHWSEQHKMFCDQGLNSNNVQLITIERDGEQMVERRVNQPPKYECVANLGYVSLFPFMMTLLEPTNSKLEAILHAIESPQLLWSPYGLRSISKSNFYYNKHNTRWDGPYWRGTIWINMNFLTLKALNHYANTEGPYQARMQSVYGRLRNNLIENIFNQYLKTGYVWEQYSDQDGKGVGTYPFTGWSALIVRIMGERY